MADKSPNPMVLLPGKRGSITIPKHQKNASHNRHTKGSEDEEDSQASDDDQSSEYEDDSIPPPKKGPGRPTGSGKASKMHQPSDSRKESRPHAPKRGPGRPRGSHNNEKRHHSPEPAKGSAGPSKTSLGKRKRRPRSETDSGNTDSDDSPDVGSPSEEEDENGGQARSKTKQPGRAKGKGVSNHQATKKRGRPAKSRSKDTSSIDPSLYSLPDMGDSPKVLDITKEQARYLRSPAFVRTTPKGPRFIEDPIPNEIYLVNKSPTDYNDKWTEEDQEELRNCWKVTDELSLRAMGTAELALWRRSIQLYGIYPVDILTGPLFFKGLGALKVTEDGEEYEIENQKWGQEFSNLMIKVITCVAFADNLNFLRYVLQYALHLRVGQASCPKPSTSDLDEDIDWHERINDFAQDKGLELVAQSSQATVNSYVKKQVRIFTTPYWKLVKGLKNHVVPDEVLKRGYQKKLTPLGLSNKDLQNIIKIWDNWYITHKDQRGALKTIKEYMDGFRATKITEKGKVREGEQARATVVRDNKRDWIMYTRGLEIYQRRNGNSSSEIPANERRSGTPINNNDYEEDMGSCKEQNHDAMVSEDEDREPPHEEHNDGTQSQSDDVLLDFSDDEEIGQQLDDGNGPSEQPKTPPAGLPVDPNRLLEIQETPVKPRQASPSPVLGVDGVLNLPAGYLRTSDDIENLDYLPVIENGGRVARGADSTSEWKIYGDDVKDSFLTSGRYTYMDVDDLFWENRHDCPRTIIHRPLVRVVPNGELLSDSIFET